MGSAVAVGSCCEEGVGRLVGGAVLADRFDRRVSGRTAVRTALERGAASVGSWGPEGGYSGEIDSLM